MDARYWMADVEKFREISAKRLVSNPTKDPTKESLLAVEQFPDGTVQVPLVSDTGGYRIGTAIVTFVNGSWTAVISLGSAEAKSLGIDLMFSQYSDTLHGENTVLVARRPKT